MLAVVVALAALAIIAAVLYAIFTGRAKRERVVVGAPPGIDVPYDSYMDAPANATGATDDLEFPPSPAPELFDLDVERDAAPPPAPELTWSKQFDPRSGVLDDTARLRLIGDLGVVAKSWCVPLLSRAYEEERRPANRQAALIALASCRSRDAIPTYRLALASGDAQERAIAADALTDLEPSAQTKPRTVVERR